MRNVLVTGATGFIGVEVIRRLGDAGIVPRVLVRRPHRAALLASVDVEPVQGDLLVPATLEAALDGIDTVIHLGGRASFESYGRLAPTLVDGTATLGRIAADAGVEHFIFSSSLFVYDSTASPIDDRTRPDPQLGYGTAKLEAEDRLVEIASAGSMTVGCLRLPHVYGPQSILFRQVRNGVAVFPGRLANHCGHLHVVDAARVLVAAAAERWQGRSAVADSTIVSWSQFFEVVQELYPYFRLVSIPRRLGLAGAAVLETVLSTQARPTLYTRDTVVGFNLDLPVAPGLVWTDLAMAPTYPSIYEGIPAVLDGYVQYRWRHPILDRRSRRATPVVGDGGEETSA